MKNLKEKERVTSAARNLAHHSTRHIQVISCDNGKQYLFYPTILNRKVDIWKMYNISCMIDREKYNTKSLTISTMTKKTYIPECRNLHFKM